MEIVYLETTFFSFYHDERPAPAIVAMRDWTRQFWEERREDYGLAWIFHKLRAATSSPPINTPLQRGVAVKTTFKPFQRFEQCAENR